ncbi:MAG: aminotransferase class IV [Solirubrobacterales bacterium]
MPVTDDGLLRGDGIFEVVRVHDGHALELDAHLERLVRSGSRLRLPVDRGRIAADIDLMLETIDEAECLLQIVLTRGGNRLIIARERPPERDHVSLAVVPHCPTPILAGAKSLSYAANMLATRLARERGFDEALFVNPEGYVLECARSAIFWVEGDTVCTPPLDAGVLASITRQQVMSLVQVVERSRQLNDIKSVGELFLADTPNGLTAVSRIEGVGEFEVPGPVITGLGSEFAKLIQ